MPLEDGTGGSTLRYDQNIALSDRLANLDNGHSALELPTRSRVWIRDHDGPARRAAVSSLSVDGTCRHVVLEQPPIEAGGNAIDRLQPLGLPAAALFVIEAESPDDLDDTLSELQSLAESDTAIERLAREWFARRGGIRGESEVISLVATDSSDLARLAEMARAGDDSLSANIWRGAEDLEGELAFVFPGSGSHFPDMGRELGLAWPEVLAHQEEETESLRRQLLPDPHGLHRLG